MLRDCAATLNWFPGCLCAHETGGRKSNGARAWRFGLSFSPAWSLPFVEVAAGRLLNVHLLAMRATFQRANSGRGAVALCVGEYWHCRE